MTLWHDTQGQGQDLLLVHGWGMNAAVWEPVLDQLEQHFTVTRVDLPGHGFSDIREHQHTLTSWLDAVMEIAPDNAVWLGWSLGGLISLKAALTGVPMKALVMMAATPSFVRHADWLCAMPRETLQQFADNLQQDTKATLMRFLSLQIQGSEDARRLLKKLRNGFSQRPEAKPQTLELGMSFLKEIDLRNELLQLNVDSFWCYGDKDTLAPACASKQISELLPDARVEVIAGAAHVPFLSHPQQVIESIVRLTQQVDQRAALS